jgi:hypothetical protein
MGDMIVENGMAELNQGANRAGEPFEWAVTQ